MSKREFLMLANSYGPSVDIGGWWMSVKLDGERAFWDGGISRGLDARDVPYANTAKDARFLTRPIATGLWSRQGKVIHAPDWWLDGLPKGPTLDMELWMGEQSFQKMRSIVGSLDKGEGWRGVVGYAIDSPGWQSVLADGELTGNFKGYLHRGMLEWVEGRCGTVHSGMGQPDECFATLKELHKSCSTPTWVPMDQVKLPSSIEDARRTVQEKLEKVASNKGEGLILRSPTSPWIPKRVDWLLKVKKLSDAEGVVTGYTWGRQTELGSKLLGKMGALVVTCHTGKRLELSGFTDLERRMCHLNGDGVTTHAIDGVPDEARIREGEQCSERWRAAQFPIGSTVTYTFRELSDDGVPKEARYLRKREA